MEIQKWIKFTKRGEKEQVLAICQDANLTDEQKVTSLMTKFLCDMDVAQVAVENFSKKGAESC